jgi:hypothetical protein
MGHTMTGACIDAKDVTEVGEGECVLHGTRLHWSFKVDDSILIIHLKNTLVEKGRGSYRTVQDFLSFLYGGDRSVQEMSAESVTLLGDAGVCLAFVSLTLYPTSLPPHLLRFHHQHSRRNRPELAFCRSTFSASTSGRPPLLAMIETNTAFTSW